VPTSAGSLEEQIRNYFRENGNKQTPVKQLMKYITKKDRNFQAIKDVKEKKEAYFVQLVAATNQVIEKIGNKVQRDGEILVSLHV